MFPRRLLFVDDHPLFDEGLPRALEAAAFDSAETAVSEGLSEEMASILCFAAEGPLDEEIAHRHGVRDSTVRDHAASKSRRD